MGIAAAMMSRARAPSMARFAVTSVLALTAVIAVFVVTQDAETARETAQPPAFAGAANMANMQQQLAQQLQRYDMAIKRVDDDISRSKVNLVTESKKLGEATQLAVKLHDKLVHDHQALQADAMQLAEVEQHARALLGPKYTPSAQELQAVSQEVNVAPPPPLSLLQT